MLKEDYVAEVESDAFEYLRYCKDAVKEAIEDDFEFASFRGGNGCDDISMHVADRDYSIQEAADVLEYCTNEETDSSSWIGRSGIRGMVSACAMQSYINDVAEQVEELYDGIRDRYEVRFEVVTEQGVVLESYEDELDAEDYEDKHEGVSVREVSNYSEIWQEFIDEHVSETVYVSDNVHELYKVVLDAGEYLMYGLRDVRVTAAGEHVFTFDEEPYAVRGDKPYKDEYAADNPDVFFEDVRRSTPRKIWGF